MKSKFTKPEIDQEQKHILQIMTPEQKIRAALDLYYSTRALKAAGLRAIYPSMSEEEIDKKVREIFLYAGT